MPSSPNYVRDYKQERKTALARGDRKRNIERLRARRLAIKAGMVKRNDGKDVDHKKPLIKGGAGMVKSNLRVRTPHANRSFARTKNAGMK